MQNTLGLWFLNVSFFLYLILYLPQLIHNTKKPTFSCMSPMMHYMLLQAYYCDLFYAVSRNMPWQYLCVSCIGTIYLLIQHAQWMRFNQLNGNSLNKSMLSIGLIILIWPVCLWFWFNTAHWQIQVQIWLSKTLFILHFLPQIFKNLRRRESIDALSIQYIILSISLSFSDLTSAYCLGWDKANVVSSILSLMIKLFLGLQIIYYQNAAKNPWIPPWGASV